MKQALANHPPKWKGHHSKKTSRRDYRKKREVRLFKQIKLKKIEKYENIKISKDRI